MAFIGHHQPPPPPGSGYPPTLPDWMASSRLSSLLRSSTPLRVTSSQRVALPSSTRQLPQPCTTAAWGQHLRTRSDCPPAAARGLSLVLLQPVPPLSARYTQHLLFTPASCSSNSSFSFFCPFFFFLFWILLSGLLQTCYNFSQLKTKPKPKTLRPSPILTPTHIFGPLCSKAL